jgi:hypothetical protein
MKKLRISAIIAVCFAVLAACGPDGKPVDQLGQEKIALNISTEGEVRIVYGVPSMVWEEEQGARTLEFVKGPAGHRTFMIQIGSDGKVKAVNQVLKPEFFMRIVQGMSQDQVRRLIGAPGKKIPFSLAKEEMWQWRWMDGTESKLFQVHFDAKTDSPTLGMVAKVTMAPDLEGQGNQR